MFRTRVVATVCAALLLVPYVPAGVPVAAAAPSASDKETARALMKDGESKREKGDHQGALQSFKAAHAIMNVPTTGLELGRTQMDLGMLVEARDTLLSVTRLPVLPGESANMPEARDEAQKLADAIEPKIPSLTIKLEGVPEGGKPSVTVDGHPIVAATIGVPRKHNPGTHEIVVVVGSVERKEKIELAEGESKEVTINLAEPPKEAPKEAPRVDEPEPAPPPPPKATSPLVWIGFGSAAAFIIAGGVTGALAFSRASSAKDGCDGTRCPPSTHDDIDASKTFGNISTVAFALAGAGVVVGVIGLYSSSSDKPAATAGQGPSLGVFVGANGIGLRGSF